MVTFGVVISDGGELKELSVRKVQDLLSGSRDAVDLELPSAFMDLVKRRLRAEKLPASPAGTLASFLHVPANSKPPPTPGSLSSSLLDGAMAMITTFKHGNQDWQAAIFDKPLNDSALFLTWYALPSPATAPEEQLKATEFELNRGLANIQGSIVSRQNITAAGQTIVECILAHPRTDKLRFYQRIVCGRTQIFSIAFVGPADPDSDLKDQLRRLFDSMRFD